jgi:sucrose phosphorylase
MAFANKVQLITYVDRLSGAGVPALHQLLNKCLPNVFAGVHLLPFYTPIDGEDAGFDPTDHAQVDPRLGQWNDVASLGDDYELMADLIVNHTSAQSKEFQDVLQKGQDSAYWDLFLTKQKVFGEEPDKAEIAKIFRPRPTSPFTPMQLADGSVVDFWTTFTSNQIDIDVNSEHGQAYLENILTTFAKNNIKLIRLDAAGYAIKQAGTNCFMMPETFAFIEALSARAEALGMTCLVEIHSYHKIQCEIAKRCSLVYDFALPPLVLHAMNTRDLSPLHTWLEMAPRNCINVLDTHDGIGIVDVGANGDEPGLLTPAQINALVESIHAQSDGQSRLATGAAASNVDLYQVNCTFYSALGCDDYRYLLARTIQLFSPGTPQIYYAGLLALKNDMALLADTGVGRDINRPYLNESVVIEHLQKPVVQALLQLITLRNQHQAFQGEFSQEISASQYSMIWQQSGESITLTINLDDLSAHIVTDSDTLELTEML